MKALIFKEKVVQVEEIEFPVAKDLVWVDCPNDCVPGWIYENGAVHAPIIPQKSIEDILNEYRGEIESFMNSVAYERGYQTALSCISYLNSSVDLWASEAKAFLSWRDSVWSYILGEIEKLRNGQREVISFDDFSKEFPTIGWP
jgi:hypothetical protein